MDLGLKDKVVVCMSSASGFGKGIATEFAREGAKVVICTSEAFKAELDQAVIDIEKETGNRPHAYLYDVLDNKSIAAMINKVAEDLGGIYGLVNHCPGPKAGTFEALTEADWADGYQKCLYSYTTAIRAALPYMKQGGGGRIVNSTSSSIKQELDNLILSNTFRMGVVGMSKTMAREFGPVQHHGQHHRPRPHLHRPHQVPQHDPRGEGGHHARGVQHPRRRELPAEALPDGGRVRPLRGVHLLSREQRDLRSGHLRRRRHDHCVLSLSSQHTLISLTGKRQRLFEPLPFPIPFTDRRRRFPAATRRWRRPPVGRFPTSYRKNGCISSFFL